MSMTTAAYSERKWGMLPALRQALEDKEIPGNYYGLTSVSDNIFDMMHRLLEISILVREYDKYIIDTAQSVGKQEMDRDLRMLEYAFKHASYFFRDAIEVSCPERNLS
jgi:serine/threonine-protein kinase RIO1